MIYKPTNSPEENFCAIIHKTFQRRIEIPVAKIKYPTVLPMNATTAESFLHGPINIKNTTKVVQEFLRQFRMLIIEISLFLKTILALKDVCQQQFISIKCGGYNLMNINFANISGEVKVIDTLKCLQKSLAELSATLSDEEKNSVKQLTITTIFMKFGVFQELSKKEGFLILLQMVKE